MKDLQTIIENKLKQLDKKFTQSGDNYLLSQCINPTHIDKKPSFSINTETGKGFCFTCDFKVDLAYWVNGELDETHIEEIERNNFYQNIKNRLNKQEESIKEEKQIFFPPDSKEEVKDIRGLSEQTISDLNFYICRVGRYKDRLIIPMSENSFEAWSLTKQQPKYFHSKGFNPKDTIYPPLKENENYVIVTEGIFDALSLYDLDLNSLCNFGVANNFSKNKIKELLKQGIETIYLMLDRDEAGIEATKEIKTDKVLNEFFTLKPADKFKHPKIQEFYKTNYKDFNDFYVNT